MNEELNITDKTKQIYRKICDYLINSVKIQVKK